jgi:PAS domain S-box-containing protein
LGEGAVYKAAKGKSMRKLSPAKTKVIAVVLLAGVLPLLVSVAAYLISGGAKHVQEPVHEGFELAGSCIALAVATLLMLRMRHEEGSQHLFWVVASLIAMGLVDGLHGVHGISLWSWQRHGATLIGGVLFGLVWLPLPLAVTRRKGLFVFVVAGLALALGIWWGSEWMPVTWDPVGLYIFPVKAANALGGLGFLAAALFFIRRYLRHPHIEDLVFASLTLVFSTSGLLFGLSHTWAVDWWVWHGFRLLAYAIVLVIAYDMVVALYARISRHAQELKVHVQERTAQLATANTALQKSLERLEFANRATFNAIWDWDLRTNGLEWNENFQMLFGYRADEVEPGIESWTNRIHPEDLDRVSQSIHAAIDSGKQSWSDHYRFRRKDNSFADVEDRGYISRKTSGLPFRMIGAMRDVTESRRAEEALREAHEQLERRVEERTAELQRTMSYNRGLIEASVDPLVTIGPEGKITDVNGATETITGRSRKELLGTDFSAYFTDPEKASAVHKQVFDKGAVRDYELHLRHRDGHMTPVHYNASVYRDETGGVVGIFAAARDMTEVKNTESDLIRSKMLLEETGRLARMGGWELDLRNNVLSFSDMVKQIHEVDPEYQPTLEAAIKFYAPEAVPVISEAVRRAIDYGESYDVELQLITAKQNRIWVRAIGQAYRDSGEIIRVGGVFQDINARKLAEIEARKNSEQLQRLSTELEIIIDSIPGLVFYKDKNNRFIRVNKYMCDVYKMSKKQLEGLSLNALHSEEQAQAYYEDDLQVIRSRRPKLNIDEPWETEAGLRWVSTSKIPYINETGEAVGIIGVSLDVTERKLAENELKRHREHLEEMVKERTEKLAVAIRELERSNKELELFAYVASHDLQEPLRMISSYTQLLAQRYEGQLDEKAKKYIAYAVDGSVRMQRLINDLLTYSRISTRGKSLQPTDAHAVLGEAMGNLQAVIEESGALVTNDDLPTVRADTSQLLQIFQNLIANALKFRGDTPPRIHVSAQDQGSEWLFSVRDNGIGIDREYADRLFVIFQRLHTRQEYPGTGIGLAVCKRIVERHGGRIWFESETGKGSTFFFTILK